MRSHKILTAVTLVAIGLFAVACETADHGEHHDHDHSAALKPAVDTFIDVWNTGDFDRLDAIASGGFNRIAPGGMNADSLEVQKELMRKFRAAYPDIYLVITESHYLEDLAIVRWNVKGTNTGPGDPPPTGKSVDITGLTLLRFEGGKLVLEEVYFDALGWMEQLGLTLTSSSG